VTKQKVHITIQVLHKSIITSKRPYYYTLEVNNNNTFGQLDQHKIATVVHKHVGEDNRELEWVICAIFLLIS